MEIKQKYHKSRRPVETAELPLLEACNTTGIYFSFEEILFSVYSHIQFRRIAYYAKSYDSYLLPPQPHSFQVMHLTNDLSLAENNGVAYLYHSKSWKGVSENSLPGGSACSALKPHRAGHAGVFAEDIIS